MRDLPDGPGTGGAAQAFILQLGANGQHRTRISPEHVASVTKWRWQYKVSAHKHKKKVYAKRTTRIGGRKVTILLSHFILIECMGVPRPSPLHTADHINDDSLDDTKENLQWLLPSEQVAKQKRTDGRFQKKPLATVQAL